jgi:DNA-directed RNA polymerase sigma subunit (sigma70/sigma32)
MSVTQVQAMQARTAPILSLDTPIADSRAQLGSLLAERTVHNPLDTAVETELSDPVRSGLQARTPREAYIVRARFGMDTGGGATCTSWGFACAGCLTATWRKE